MHQEMRYVYSVTVLEEKRRNGHDARILGEVSIWVLAGLSKGEVPGVCRMRRSVERADAPMRRCARH